ncbi:MAG: beta-N-acetylhexosaminidase [bacterium]
MDKLIEGMGVEEKVAQLMMIGFEGLTPPEYVVSMIHRGLGGVILFSRNIDTPQQVASLTNALQDEARRSPHSIPLLVAADQEGGQVIRLSKGATQLPGNMALGATRSPQLAREAGRITGMELAAVGINMNLAPVLDVNNNPQNPVINTRSFGESPDLVSQLGLAYIEGLHEEGVIATAKHFPGHGDTAIDSHIALPTIPHPRGRLEKIELKPFRDAIKAGVDAVMTAHITFPAIEPTEGLPATLSPKVLTDLLRGELGFGGVIVTDAMEMKAIDDNFETGAAAVMAVKAGADIVLITAGEEKQKRAFEALVDAVNRGEIPRERLNAKVSRILTLKQKYRLAQRAPVDPSQIPLLVGADKSKDIAAEIAYRAITLVKDDGLLPIDPKSPSKILVATPIAMLANSIIIRHERTDYTPLSFQPKDEEEGARELKSVREASKGADLIVMGIATPHQAKLTRELQDLNKPIVAISFGSPYYIASFPKVRTYIAAYSSRPASVEGAVRVIFGEISSQGRLPVTIPGVAKYGDGLTVPISSIGFTIQVGAFSKKEEAEALAEKLRKAGYDARVEKGTTRDGSTIHRVRVGRYPSEAEASGVAEKMFKEMGLTYWIVRE